MLLKVKYLSVKKYIKLHASFTYLEFISEVKTKFGLPDAAHLEIFDETDTAVDEDIFLELLEAHPDLCLTVAVDPVKKTWAVLQRKRQGQ
ncbi:unnamed protein product [Boreogadus saida]